jgi:methyl-accepting chemotaxis protein
LRGRGVFSELTANVIKVSNLIGEIAVASSEQFRGIEQIDQAVAEMNDLVRNNSGINNQFQRDCGQRRNQADSHY